MESHDLKIIPKTIGISIIQLLLSFIFHKPAEILLKLILAKRHYN